MRVLMCSWKDEAHPLAGGAEYWTGGVLRHWARLGVDVVLATSRADASPAHEIVHGVEIRRGGDYRFGVQAHARSVFERYGPFDLVIDQINTRPFNAPRWARPAPVVAIIHQLARDVWDAELPAVLAAIGRRVLEPRWLRPYADVPTFTISPSSAASLRDYGLRNVDVIPVGSDSATPQRATPRPKEAVPTFVTCGRLSRSKRPDHAIEAFRIVREVLPDAQLWMIGTGPLENGLRRSLPDGATMLGHLETYERDDRMARAHALLMTSVREGWGLVVSEAAAVGTRTIGYRVPGLVDSIPACDGVLTAPRPDALAQAMIDNWSTFATSKPPLSTGTVPVAEAAEALLDRALRATRPAVLV
ncbi:MAG TPA: glycosyltransferase family 4 protein [Acidimicrobiales bacterium]